MTRGGGFVGYDWFTILLYVLLVGFGWINIYSASLSNSTSGLFDFDRFIPNNWFGSYLAGS